MHASNAIPIPKSSCEEVKLEGQAQCGGFQRTRRGGGASYGRSIKESLEVTSLASEATQDRPTRRSSLREDCRTLRDRQEEGSCERARAPARSRPEAKIGP